MSVISIRIPGELKKKIDSLKGLINWSEEIRKFIEGKIREIEQEKAIEELEALIQKLPETSRGLAARYVREDRDSN
jgi:metal-responsive CopG/Arc/MetJ family transcriptional regulator